MSSNFDPTTNYRKSKESVGYITRTEATPDTYAGLGFMSGLEIHQQLLTKQKLFCRCPAGIYQEPDDYAAEVIRHMRPTLSEMGEYDGTALMERKTKKNIIYRLKHETACTYEIDDTPPFPLNLEALDISVEIALLLGLNIVGELHITRKQYLDGSIPTGFQRTGIVGIEGEIPISTRTIRIIQLSLEEDSCREVSDIGHWRTYMTDRLGMPLIEMVTYPDMKTPDEVAEACHYLRFIARSTGHVRVGIGAGREDVNVSIKGGTRVEIKGVAHIKRIPELSHNEAFRQAALLAIRKILKSKIADPVSWKPTVSDIDLSRVADIPDDLARSIETAERAVAINLPGCRSVLSHFTQPGQCFADELAGRLKVIACLERPNLMHSEPVGQEDSSCFGIPPALLDKIKKDFKAGNDDAQLVVWGPHDDVVTAIDVLGERVQLAYEGVPNETRKSLPDGTTIFERVLPGPDRMYPDTDSAPISIPQKRIDELREQLPPLVCERVKQFDSWSLPRDTYSYLLRNNLSELVEKIIAQWNAAPRLVASILGHRLKNLQGKRPAAAGFGYELVHDLFKFASRKKLDHNIVSAMLPVLYDHPKMTFESVLTTIGYAPNSISEIMAQAPAVANSFRSSSDNSQAQKVRWIMGRLRGRAIGNVNLAELRAQVERMVTDE